MVGVIGVLLVWHIKGLKDEIKSNSDELKENTTVQSNLTTQIALLYERMNTFEKQQVSAVAELQRNQRENFDWIMKLRDRTHDLGNYISQCFQALDIHDMIPKNAAMRKGVDIDEKL
jgi:hypothetical protein